MVIELDLRGVGEERKMVKEGIGNWPLKWKREVFLVFIFFWCNKMGGNVYRQRRNLEVEQLKTFHSLCVCCLSVCIN